MYHQLCKVISIVPNTSQDSSKDLGKPLNVQLRYRVGSPTSYVLPGLRGPKVTSLSMGGRNVHAFRQLEGFRLVPRS